DAHRIDHAVGRKTFGHRHGAIGRDRVVGYAAQHDLSVAGRDANMSAAGTRYDFFSQVFRIDHDLKIDHADDVIALIEYGQVGGANLLALDVERVVRHWQHVRDVGGADHRRRERLVHANRT